MSHSPQPWRLSSGIRGAIITVLIGAYAYLTQQPGATMTASLLIAASLQVGVLLLRKFVPAELLPHALHVFELLVDAATILLFALGVFGGILRAADDV